MSNRLVEVESVGEALLELLDARGVEFFFGGGSGTDFPPIIEAFAKRLAQGKTRPRPMTVVHEITTIAMAHGYTMVSGQPQAAMLHTTVGTANGIGGIINASRARVPIFLMAGRSSITEKGHVTSRSHGVHWGQEAFDQAGMLREFVKWDYELRRGEQLETVVDRALAIARNEPAGPVYLTLPLEVIGEKMERIEYSEGPRITPSGPTQPSTESIAHAAATLAEANNAVAIVTSLGRDPLAVQPLVDLAEQLALPVVEFWHTHLNFPQDHHLHMGYEAAPYVKDADVVVVLESDAPWFPRDFAPPQDATIIQIDEDPLYERYPIRGFPTDVPLRGTPRLTLRALNRAMAEHGLDEQAVSARRRRWTDEHERLRASWKTSAEAVSGDNPLDPLWISRCVGAVLEDADIAITEYTLEPTQTCFRRPGTFFNHSHAAGLGWAPGAAMGAKLAKPDTTVVCAMGDGCHVFGVPVATHYMSQAYGLPVLFVIFNNAGWNKSRLAAFNYAPSGWARKADSVPLCELEPAPAYEKVCEAAGGYGERVDEPQELPAALERALKVVREEKRQALLNVVCTKD